jgi:uncharacterized protein (TIGR03083 family)
MIPTDTINKLAECFDSLSELGSSLTEAQWKTPTDLEGWTVQDNLSHLVGIERMLEGLAGTSHKSPPATHVKNPIGESNENEIDSRRHLSGAQVLAEWKDIAAQRLKTLRGADDEYFAASSMTPTGPGTLADFLHIRVLDCWVHEQDMRRAVNQPGHLGGPAAEHTIDRLIRTLPIVVGKRASTPEGASVVIDITADPVHGGVSRHIVTTVTNGRAAISDIESDNVLARLSMDTETFLILATGRQSLRAVEDRVTFSGDRDHGKRVAEALNMMI